MIVSSSKSPTSEKGRYFYADGEGMHRLTFEEFKEKSEGYAKLTLEFDYVRGCCLYHH
jgi:hypothetical protein